MSAAAKTVSRERSFVQESKQLLLGEGEVFHGEAILGVTKALLQSGVSYVGGYPGAPVSHLMDVLADARDTVLEPYGIYFEQSASEAGAAALLATSVNYPLRGAVTWKSIVGTNVASDALSNVASSGVGGGAVVLVGEDYGEGASVIQERTHAMAMKSSIPLIDPRYDMQTIVDLTEQAFEMSETGHLPVFLSLRIRACHMTGSFVCKANRPSAVKTRNAPLTADLEKRAIPLPPFTYEDERSKLDDRLPAVQRFIAERRLNEHRAGDARHRFGIVMQGGTYGVVMRALARLGLADGYGDSDVPLLILNVIHPLVPDEITGFLEGKDSVLVVEEGHPAFIESQVRDFAQQAGVTCRVHGKDMIPTTGEYVAAAVRAGLANYFETAASKAVQSGVTARNQAIAERVATARERAAAKPLPPRPPGFCTGCPERPIFTALKLIMRERGALHVSLDIGCSSFASLAPLNVGNTIAGYGLSLASGGAIGATFDQPTVAVMGDGAFWHNGLTSGAANAQWQGMDAVLIVLENGYASATGQQHVPSTGATPVGTPKRLSIEGALRGIGVDWIRRVDSYDLAESMAGLRAALDARGPRLRVVISDNECMLAKKRRERQAAARTRVAPPKARYGVDAEVCTGDHSCIRLNGCPSLTLKPTEDPLKDGPTAHVDNSCAACNLCGEVAQAAQLCPSFYKAEGGTETGPLRRLSAVVNDRLMSWMGAS